MVFIKTINGSYSFTFDNDEIRIAIFVVSSIGMLIVASLACIDCFDEMWSIMLSFLINLLFNTSYNVLSLPIIESPAYLFCIFIYVSFAFWQSCTVRSGLSPSKVTIIWKVFSNDFRSSIPSASAPISSFPPNMAFTGNDHNWKSSPLVSLNLGMNLEIFVFNFSYFMITRNLLLICIPFVRTLPCYHVRFSL